MKKSPQYVISAISLCLLLTISVHEGPDAAHAGSADTQSPKATANPDTAKSIPMPAQTTPPPTRAERTSLLHRIINPPDAPQAIRLATWNGLSITEAIVAYGKTIDFWGKPNGKFHLKDDLKGDGMALNDEVSHVFIAYKMAQLARQGYRWSGLSPRAAACAGAIQAAAHMTFVEFPLDAYNPRQGFGISDFMANVIGIGLAWYRAGVHSPRWDLKISVKSRFFEGDSRLIAHTNRQYDDYIYWLTCRVSQNRYNPLVVGVGYSTRHPPDGSIHKELHFRIGTSLSEIGRIFGRRSERILSPAEFYFLSVGPYVDWK